MSNEDQMPAAPQGHEKGPVNMDHAKKLAELGGLMVCAPIAVKMQDPTSGQLTEVKVSLADLIIQIAQGSPLASNLHPVRRMVDGKEAIENTSALQLLAEIADGVNDLCCMADEFLESQGLEEEEEDDEEPPRRGKSYRR